MMKFSTKGNGRCKSMVMVVGGSEARRNDEGLPILVLLSAEEKGLGN